MMEDEEHYLELVMPFVACKSEGGLYDDESFTAGWRAGCLWMSLQDAPDFAEILVDEALRAQFDLIAMHFNYQMTVGDFDDDGWAHAHLVKCDDL